MRECENADEQVAELRERYGGLLQTIFPRPSHGPFSNGPQLLRGLLAIASIGIVE